MPTETAKPKPSGKRTVVGAPEAIANAKRSIAETGAFIDRSEDVIASTKALLSKLPGKLGAEKLTPEEQKRRFIEAAREAGASEDEADFDAAVKRIAKPRQAS